MNYLEICKRVRQEAGIAGTGPSAVTNQTGEYKRIVDWCASAWDDLQMLRNDWRWMNETFSFVTIADQDTYTPAQAGIASRFRRWDRDNMGIYTTTTGVADELDLDYMPWEVWRTIFRRGTNTAQRPTTVTTLPDQSLGLGYKPTAGYTVRGEYWKSVQELADDSDTPEMPDEYHMAIVYRALMMYGRFMAAGEVYDDAERNYNRILDAIISTQAPEILIGGALE